MISLSLSLFDGHRLFGTEYETKAIKRRGCPIKFPNETADSAERANKEQRSRGSSFHLVTDDERGRFSFHDCYQRDFRVLPG